MSKEEHMKHREIMEQNNQKLNETAMGILEEREKARKWQADKLMILGEGEPQPTHMQKQRMLADTIVKTWQLEGRLEALGMVKELELLKDIQTYLNRV